MVLTDLVDLGGQVVIGVHVLVGQHVLGRLLGVLHLQLRHRLLLLYLGLKDSVYKSQTISYTTV